MENQKIEWEESYKNKDNFLFYPQEEIIRFFSKYISKKTGLNSYIKKHNENSKPKVLDLGCGIGRHIVFANDMGAESYGIDLSETAISIAKEWAESKKIHDVDRKIIQSDITNMPFDDNYFDFIISHGVLDSMSIINCQNTIKEASRVLKKQGLFYCDLISGDDSLHHLNFSGEEIVATDHEKNTIQLYFNEKMIEEFFSNYFEIIDLVLVKRYDILKNSITSRYHLVLKNK